jgi:4-hydroxybenzoate polyprenyltransferase
VLPILQLTRMALVFTAIADSTCTFLLWAKINQLKYSPQSQLLQTLDAGDARKLGAVVVMSIGLYGFGMSLNDIIDRRRDRQISPARPLPSGRVGVVAAHIICVALGLAALLAGAYYMRATPHGWMSLALVVGTILLITFYDFAGKYLVAPGLLSLGLIRFFHALIPAPRIPLIWHPLLLLNHVTLLSLIAYRLEEKRPPLTRIHGWAVLGGLGLMDVAVIGILALRRVPELTPFAVTDALWVRWGLLLPIIAVVLFVVVAWTIRQRAGSAREAGQRMMLAGLLWLIVYDAAFVAGYVSWMLGLVLLLLLPVAWAAVRIMRWWSKLLAAPTKQTFRRVES